MSLNVVLASASPRRRELLAAMGLTFEIRPANLDEETIVRPTLEETLAALCEAKALAVRRDPPNELVIGVDTMVVYEGKPYNKPRDADDARHMLHLFRNRPHEVWSGIALVTPDSMMVQIVRSQVWMRDYSDAEIEDYIARGEPFDKAGAYGIQDPIFHPVSHVLGCPLNVVGLPACLVEQMLAAAAIEGLTSPASICLGAFGPSCIAEGGMGAYMADWNAEE